MYQRWGAFLGWVSQGLQHEVIAMASCCKKGGGQKGNNCHRQTCTGTTGITVLRRDWVVAVVPPPAGTARPGGVTLLRTHSFLTLNGLASPRAHSRNYHNGKSIISGSLASLPSSRRPLNAMACCILVSSEVSHRIARMVNPLSVHTEH